MKHPIVSFPEIDSTNTYLKREYKNYADGTVITAEHQTAGKGRSGREWVDDSKSLVFSLLLKDNLEPERVSLLSLLSGLCVSLALDDLGIQNQIKWPNDVLIHEKKAVGILSESVVEGKLQALIIGIGINLNQDSFSSSLKDKATSLYLQTEKKYEKLPFLECFLHYFDIYYDKFLKEDDSFLDAVRERSYLTGKQVYLNYYGEDRHATVKGIDNDGNLLVDEDGKTVSLNSGEVTLEKNYH